MWCVRMSDIRAKNTHEIETRKGIPSNEAVYDRHGEVLFQQHMNLAAPTPSESTSLLVTGESAKSSPPPLKKGGGKSPTPQKMSEAEMREYARLRVMGRRVPLPTEEDDSSDFK